jgi:hypothetical protein
MRTQRTPTKREIKMAICTHGRWAQTGAPAERPGGGWRTKVQCAICGFWYLHETAADDLSATVTPTPVPPVLVTAVPAVA